MNERKIQLLPTFSQKLALKHGLILSLLDFLKKIFFLDLETYDFIYYLLKYYSAGAAGELTIEIPNDTL